MIDIGTFSLQTSFAAGSHAWKEGMDANLLKLSMFLQLSVKSRTTPLPATGNNNDRYIDPVTEKICMWIDTDWYAATPTNGNRAYVEDEDIEIVFDTDNHWTTLFDPDWSPAPVPRTLAMYAPGPIPPSKTVLQYAPALELVIPAGAPGSFAGLDIAPTSDIVFPIIVPDGGVTNITFAAGSTIGVINLPNGAHLYPFEDEGQYSQVRMMIVSSPANLHGAEGLSITFAGQIEVL